MAQTGKVGGSGYYVQTTRDSGGVSFGPEGSWRLPGTNPTQMAPPQRGLACPCLWVCVGGLWVGVPKIPECEQGVGCHKHTVYIVGAAHHASDTNLASRSIMQAESRLTCWRFRNIMLLFLASEPGIARRPGFRGEGRVHVLSFIIILTLKRRKKSGTKQKHILCNILCSSR